VGMGVLPLVFPAGVDRRTLGLDGSETFDLVGLAAGLRPRMPVGLRIHRADGRVEEVELLARLDTEEEVEYDRHGGILHYVLRQLLAGSTAGSA